MIYLPLSFTTGDRCNSNVMFNCKNKLSSKFHDDDSDVHTEIAEFGPVIQLKMYLYFAAKLSEEKKGERENLQVEKRPKIIEKQFAICLQTNAYLTAEATLSCSCVS